MSGPFAWLGAAALAAAPASPIPDGAPVLARVRLAGPLALATLDQGERGRTELSAGLLAGERREIVVPLPYRPLDGRAPATRAAPPGGAAEFVDWEPAEAPLAPLPPGLAARPRPPVAGRAPEVRPASLALLAAAAVLVTALRRRPAAALAAGWGVALALGIVALRSPPRAAPPARVLEGAGPEGPWLVVDGGAGELSFPLAGGARLEVAPAGAPVVWSGTLVGETARWRVRLAGGRLWRVAPLEVGLRLVRREINAWGPIEEAWSRAPDGRWSHHGAWLLGQPLPPAASDAPAPPGWLAAGLPQGVGVLVARLAPDAWRGPELHGTAPGAAWLRLTRF